jgi:FlgD Ig-like domain
MILLALALLLGSAAAFTRTERLKLRPGPIGKPHYLRHFSPTCQCGRSKARFSFLLRGADVLDVYVVNSDGHDVATLARNQKHSAGRVEVKWDGRESSGLIAPDGEYRLRIHLRNARRSILVPTTTQLDTVPPRARVLPLAQTTVSPGEAGIDGTLDVRVRTSEPGRAILLVDGKAVLKSDPFNARATIQWDGTRHGRVVAPGMHELTVVVLDRAGNRSEPEGPLAVTVG